MNVDHDTLTQSGADQTIARKHNRAQILNRLRIQGAASRADLAKQTDLTRSSISRIVEDLLEEKLVHEIASAQNDRGRPSILLALNPKGGAAIGLEIGVHFISILLTDFFSTPIWRERITLDDNATWTTYIEQAEELIDQTINIAAQNELPLKGIGVAVWGMVNNRTRMIHFAPNLQWRDVPLEARWSEMYDVPVYVENDANASALGEYYFGAGKEIEDFVYLSMDIGIGSGIISKGHLFRGASGYAGEIGHIMIDPNGAPCSCGRRGCLETKVGRHVIIQRYHELSKGDSIPLENIIQRGQAGDPIARMVFDEVGEALGTGIGYVVNLLNPKCVIFGWSLGQAFNLLLPGVQRSLEKSCLSVMHEELKLIPSINGSDDALLGSIALVLDDVIRETL